METLSKVKYEKFSTDEEKSQKPSKAPLLVVCILLIVCTVLLTAAVVAIGVGVGVSVTKETTQPLQVFTLSEGELQGQYNGATGGINFQSTINDTHVYLSITTTDGRVIVLFLRPLNTQMTMADINNTYFMMKKNEEGSEKYTEYLVPENLTGMMNSMMTDQKNMSDKDLEQLDTKNVAEASQFSLRALAMSPEASLIIEAAEALGDLGIQGSDSAAVWRFYQFAITLSNTREQDTTVTGYSETNDNGYKRRRRQTQCPRDGRGCDGGGTCPYGNGGTCFGMCGKGCTCWRFVCDDCCVHEYCRSHDACCADRGFFTFSCFRVGYDVLGSRCTDTYDC